jgi:hypothetical protein
MGQRLPDMAVTPSKRPGQTGGYGILCAFQVKQTHPFVSFIIWRRSLLVCWLLASLLAVQGAHGERIDPFTVFVPVGDQGEAERRLALRAALRKVLVQLTGQQSLVDEALTGRGQLLQEQQIQYLELPPLAVDGDPRPVLEVVFEAESVLTLVRQLGLPVWPLERGACIVWVAIDDGLNRELLGAMVEHEPLQQVLLQASDERGLPLILPLMDLMDRQQVAISDVWAGFADHLEQASVRYAVPCMLVGRVFSSGGRWHGRWQLREPQVQDRWEQQADDLQQLLVAGVGGAADRLGQRHGVSALAADERLMIRVYGVQDAGDYARVIGHLEQLSVVTSVDPVRVAPGVTDLALVTSAGGTAVVDALALERMLEPIESSVRRDPNVRLEYRLPR